MNPDAPLPAAILFGGSSDVADNPTLRNSIAPFPPPAIPDHELIRLIGRGSYGQVWLAKNAVGTLRAIKVVYRATFEKEEHFEREFKGLQKFEPISRLHDGFVDILQLGRNEEAGCFYYVMELADGAEMTKSEFRIPKEARNPNFKATDSLETIRASDFRLPSSFDIRHSDFYTPRTLRDDLKQRGALPIGECLAIGAKLASALEHLHAQGLVHRDIKPSNIIFVSGEPKLADIGLVTNIDDAHSMVGTVGYIPPEGPGAAQADIYSLGKVLYEIALAKDRQDFPQLPPDLQTQPDHAGLLELNEVIIKACAHDPRRRYQSARRMQEDLALLQTGKSVKRKRTIQRRWATVTKLNFVAGMIGLIAVGGFFLRQIANEWRPPSRGATLELEMNGTKNREAWNAYVKGQHYFNRDTRDGSTRAIEFLNEAIRLDPNFAEPYAALAEIYRWSDYLFPSGKEAMTKGKEAALRALALDDSLAKAHLELGYVAAHLDRDFSAAEKELKRAITLSHEYAGAHACYGWILLEIGRLKEAEKEMSLAQQFDPISPHVYCNSSCVFRSAGRVDEAVEQLYKALDLRPNFVWAFEQLTEIHEEKGELPEAIEMLRKAAVARGMEPEKAAQQSDDLRRALSTRGARGYWQKKLELANVLSSFGGDLYDIAVIYLHLGQKDSALEFLRKLEAQKSDFAFRINFDRRFDSLRSEPRFKALLGKLGLEK